MAYGMLPSYNIHAVKVSDFEKHWNEKYMLTAQHEFANGHLSLSAQNCVKTRLLLENCSDHFLLGCSGAATNF